MRILNHLASGAVLAVMLTVGAAEAQSGSPGGAGDMMGRMPAAEGSEHMGREWRRYHGIGMPFEHIEGRIAFLKAEIKITEAQSGPWNAFADVLRSCAKGAQDMRAKMKPQEAVPTLPEFIDAHEKSAAWHLEQLHKVHAAITPLYAVLSGDQKKVADSLIREMGAM